jgi:prolyl-tRNA editing enzyme YbaK/EbsC (Cys-tRNA(Pro) deacylase)
MIAIEERISDLENRIERANQDFLSSKNHVLVDLRNKNIWTAALYRVPSNYYDESLDYRSNILKCNVDQLCKTILVQNCACIHNEYSDILDSKYYCIIIQYSHKLNAEKLKEFVHNLKAKEFRVPKKRFNFQLAPEDISAELTGFSHNAVSPFGLSKVIPIILCAACTAMSPPYMWMGGGEVDLKLGMPLSDFLRATNALIADISEPRDV